MKLNCVFSKQKRMSRLHSCVFNLALFTVLVLVTASLTTSCNHNKGGTHKPSTPEGSEQPKPTLKDLHLNTLTIKTQDAKPGSLRFERDGITIDENDIKIEFVEKDAPKNFKFTPSLPFTVKAGEEKKLLIEAEVTDKYNKFVHGVKITCTNKKMVEIDSITVHGEKVGDDDKIEIGETYNTITDKNIIVTFKQKDVGVPTFEGLPISLEAGKEFSFKISTNATDKYEAFNKTVTIIVKREIINDCIKALGNRLAWKEKVVNEELSLPNSVEGFEGSTVTWKSKSPYLNDAGKIMMRNIVDVEAEMEAKVTWNNASKATTFKTIVKKIEKIRDVLKGGGLTVTCTADFSKDNILKYWRTLPNANDELMLEFEIKEVDAANSLLVAELKKKSIGTNKLLACEELIKSKVKQYLDGLDKVFSSKYFALKNNNNPQWQDIEDYLTSTGIITNEDDSIDKKFNKFKGLSDYQGSQPEFINLQPSEKQKHILNMLNVLRDEACDKLKVARTTNDDKLLDTLKKATLSQQGISARHYFREWKYRYEIKKSDNADKYPDGYSFTAKAIFDATKEWYNQLGFYGHADAGNKSSLKMLEADGMMQIESEIYDEQAKHQSNGVVKTGNTFELRTTGTNKQLIFNVQKSSTATDSVEVKITGGVTKDLQMQFNPYTIFDVLDKLQ